MSASAHAPSESTSYQADPAAQAAMRSPRPAGHGPVRAYDWIAHHAAHRPAKEAVRELRE
jgi:fatty-acyl-CoA synthase